MRYRNFLISIFTLCIFYGLSSVDSANLAPRIPDYLELIRADSLSHDGRAEVTRIFGDVIFRKGSQRLRCDLFIFYHRSERVIFRGNVVFEDSSRYLRADKVEYFANPEKEVATGNVRTIVDQKEINSQKLTYFADEEFILAQDSVQFYDPENDVRLFGGKITYDRTKEIGIAEIEPKLVKLDSLGNVDVTIIAKELQYDGEKKVATAQDSVKITQGDVIVYARTAIYFDAEDRVDLEGNPQVYQNSDRLSAKKIELFLEQQKLRKAHLLEDSKMVSNFLIQNSPASDEITGKEMWIDVVNDSLKKIRVLDQATSTYHVVEENKVQGVNQVMGDEIAIVFAQGKVSDVTIHSKPGISRGQFTPAGHPVKALKWTANGK